MKSALARLVSSSTAMLGVGMLVGCSLLNEFVFSEPNRVNLTAVSSMLLLAYGFKEAGRHVAAGRK